MSKTITREQQILDGLRGRDVVHVTELASQMDVSEATIRRDLTSMEERGLLSRVHGGATLLGLARREPLFHDKESRQTSAKQAIAHAALALIEDGDTIYLDGGSTVLQLARLLDRRNNLVIVTNSLMAASTLMDTAHRLILVGGEFRKLSRTLVGPLTGQLIAALHVDKAFMGTIGFTLAEGMTTTDPNEAHTKELIMARSSRVLLLADSSKLGHASFARSGSIEEIDTVITDAVDAAFANSLERLGVRLIVAATSDDSPTTTIQKD